MSVNIFFLHVVLYMGKSSPTLTQFLKKYMYLKKNCRTFVENIYLLQFKVRAKTKEKEIIVFDVCHLFFDIFGLFYRSFSLSLIFLLGVNMLLRLFYWVVTSSF